MLPLLSDRKPSFAFLVHFRDQDDLYSLDCGRFLRSRSADEADFSRKMCSLPPVVGGTVSFGFEPVWGELVVVMRLPHSFLEPEARLAVLKGVEVAASRGATVVGLGALTAPATQGGTALLDAMPSGITLTNGNAYTAVIVRDNVLDAVRTLWLGAPVVAVVGCGGSVGIAASHLLAEAGVDLQLLGRTPEQVYRRLGSVATRSQVLDNVSQLGDADVVAVLTSADAARLRPSDARPGAVIIDFAQPANVPPSERAHWASCGTYVIEGGLVEIPAYDSSLDLRVSVPGSTFACLAETYLFAVEGIHEHSVGYPPVELARRLERIAARRGVGASPLGRRITDERLGAAPASV